MDGGSENENDGDEYSLSLAQNAVTEARNWSLGTREHGN